jgi:hypothetical protein
MEELMAILRQRINLLRAVTYTGMALFLFFVVLEGTIPDADTCLEALLWFVVIWSANLCALLLLASASITRMESLVLTVWWIVVPIMMMLPALSMD